MPRPILLQEILDEVRAFQDGAGLPCVAAFDADGTLWSADIGEVAFVRGREIGLIDDETLLGPVRAFAARWQLDFGDEPDEIWARLSAFALKDGLGNGQAGVSDELLVDLYGLESWIFAGQHDAALVRLSEELFDGGLSASIFDEVRMLVDGLRAQQVRVLVFSGSLRAILLAGTRSLGIVDDDVFGTDPARDAQGRYLPSAITLFGDEKGVRLDAVRAGAPVVAAFGDAPAGNDRAMLERAHLPVVMNPRGRHRTFAHSQPRMRAMWVGGNGEVEAE